MGTMIVIADDEKTLADSLAYAFKREGYEVKTCYDGREALLAIENFKPDLAILDVTMPYLTGFEVLKNMKIQHAMGIMLLTAKNELTDKVKGLEIGADDYITKPFELLEVLARASALLRRLDKGEREDVQVSGALILNHASRTAKYQGKEIELTPKEFELLYTLVKNPDRVFSRDQLLELVWSLDYEGGDRTVDIHVRRLRQKLGEVGEKQLATVHRVGYKWLSQL